MNFFTDLQMEGQSGEEQAKKAISHVLNHIRRDEYVGWYLGVGTQSFALLTEAAATLFNKPVETIRRDFAPVNPRNPREDGE